MIIHKFNSKEILKELNINLDDLISLLGVTNRTIYRWDNGDMIPASVLLCINAWLKLKKMNIGWRPDSINFGEDDEDFMNSVRDIVIRSTINGIITEYSKITKQNVYCFGNKLLNKTHLVSFLFKNKEYIDIMGKFIKDYYMLNEDISKVIDDQA